LANKGIATEMGGHSLRQNYYVTFNRYISMTY
jgi:hypothetical protein